MSYFKLRLASEISDAILRGESHIEIEGRIQKLPKCQKTGTYWQRKSHADKKVIVFLEELDVKKEEEK